MLIHLFNCLGDAVETQPNDKKSFLLISVALDYVQSQCSMSPFFQLTLRLGLFLELFVMLLAQIRPSCFAYFETSSCHLVRGQRTNRIFVASSYGAFDAFGNSPQVLASELHILDAELFKSFSFTM